MARPIAGAAVALAALLAFPIPALGQSGLFAAAERTMRSATAQARTSVRHATREIRALRASPAAAAAVESSASVALAAAVTAARDRHGRTARPIPAGVRSALRGHFSDALLARARYVIGADRVSLPTLINGSRRLFGEAHGHAVTVGDVIVFSRDPGMNLDWWAHELRHVEQYQRWGIGGFSRRYVGDWRAVERDASTKASRVGAFRS